jgi:hypothetical protein
VNLWFQASLPLFFSGAQGHGGTISNAQSRAPLKTKGRILSVVSSDKQATR